MSAFAQTTTGDLDISTGNLRVERGVAQCTAWKLSNLFGFFKGEWFRDTRQGVPWFQYVYVSNPNLNLISTIFERVIKSAPGVAAITDLTLNFIPAQRQLNASFAALTNTGAILVGGPGPPFIITVKAGA
jgi:hypothetical protein